VRMLIDTNQWLQCENVEKEGGGGGEVEGEAEEENNNKD